MKLMIARTEIVAYFVVPDDADERAVQRAGAAAIREDMQNDPPADGAWCQQATPGLYEQGWDRHCIVYGTKRGEPQITLGEAMNWTAPAKSTGT